MAYPSPVATYRKTAYDAISPTQAALSVAGKTILITGGGTGIGLSIATSFAAAGASNIILAARRPDPLAKAKKSIEAAYPNTKVHIFKTSLTDHDEVVSLFKESRASIGEADILVLNAAYAPPTGPALSLSAADLATAFDTNVKGNLDMVQTYLSVPSTLQKVKTIVDISSFASYLQIPSQSAYGPSKAAFSMLLAMIGDEESKKSGLKVFSIHPGGIYTEMAQGAGYGPDSFTWDDPSLPGHFVVWLVSPEGEFLQGRFVWANWDVTELKALKEEILGNPSMLRFDLAFKGGSGAFFKDPRN